MAGRAMFTAESMNGVEKDASTVISSTVLGLTIAIFYNFSRTAFTTEDLCKGKRRWNC